MGKIRDEIGMEIIISGLIRLKLFPQAFGSQVLKICILTFFKLRENFLYQNH